MFSLWWNTLSKSSGEQFSLWVTASIVMFRTNLVIVAVNRIRCCYLVKFTFRFLPNNCVSACMSVLARLVRRLNETLSDGVVTIVRYRPSKCWLELLGKGTPSTECPVCRSLSSVRSISVLQHRGVLVVGRVDRLFRLINLITNLCSNLLILTIRI